MNWIDKANKQLEEQRAKFQESLDSGEVSKRKKLYARSQGGKAHGPKQGKSNVESGHLDNIRPLALDAFMNGDYWHSDEHKASLSKAAKASAKVNLDKGNIGKDSAMSKYKIAKKAKERAKLLLNLNEEFMAKDAKEYFSKKQWFYVRDSDLVINTGRKGGYHNCHPIYKLNHKAIELALITSDDPKDYFETK